MSSLRVVCMGCADEPYISLSQLESLMGRVASGELECPEVEIHDEQGRILVHLGGLWSEGAPGPARSWLVATDFDRPRFSVVCDGRVADAPRREYVYCGAPTSIAPGAVLDVARVLEVVPMVLSHQVREPYTCLPLAEALHLGR